MRAIQLRPAGQAPPTRWLLVLAVQRDASLRHARRPRHRAGLQPRLGLGVVHLALHGGRPQWGWTAGLRTLGKAGQQRSASSATVCLGFL